ncbi:MAG: tRNA pseudouridine(13) synthase TruD [Chloroflexota bacterium]|nr:tRNA pseudouridine(13) synthase TruD [Chloroflexota bacterium]
MQTLPFFTPNLPGCGGQLKAQPSHFVVEEIPLYEASGQGAHLYLSITREGWNTKRVADSLAKLYGINGKDVGYAGLKDRHARSTQTFSLPGLAPSDADRIEEKLPFSVNWARCHNNKLKVGHLLGNRFRITVTDMDVPADEALCRAQPIATTLKQRGMPNFFGAQRFGTDGTNAARGREVLLGGGPHKDKWLRKLLISAYQSQLFNSYLTRRLERGLFDHLLLGDVAKKADTGGMFDVEDEEVEQPRYERGEIHFTGPIYGKKMWPAKKVAGELEREILEEAGLTEENWRRARTQGTRRPGRLWLPEISLGTGDSTLELAFFLPKGSYATIVLREFTKNKSAAIIEKRYGKD